MAAHEILLPTPKSSNAAQACREMGLTVGDSILGAVGSAHSVWSETKLTLLWLGESVAVWHVQNRRGGEDEWSAPEETSNWCLGFRSWRKVFH